MGSARVYRAIVMLLCVCCPPLTARTPVRVETWDEVAGSISQQFIALHLPDGTNIRGIGEGTDGAFLLMMITRSSNHHLHPRGNARIARTEVSEIDVLARRQGAHIGAAIGTGIGAAAVAPIAFVVGSKANGGAAAVVLAAGATAEWFVGRHFDNDSPAHFRIVLKAQGQP